MVIGKGMKGLLFSLVALVVGIHTGMYFVRVPCLRVFALGTYLCVCVYMIYEVGQLSS